jgi:hypothetical protein
MPENSPLIIEPCKYINDKIHDTEEKTDLKIIALTAAFNKAESTLNIRLESMNEFRKQLADQAGTFISREEARLEIQNAVNELNSKITALQYLVLALILAFIGAFIKSVL